MKKKTPFVKQLVLERTLAKRRREKDERSHIEVESNVFIKKWGSESFD